MARRCLFTRCTWASAGVSLLGAVHNPGGARVPQLSRHWGPVPGSNPVYMRLYRRCLPADAVQMWPSGCLRHDSELEGAPDPRVIHPQARPSLNPLV